MRISSSRTGSQAAHFARRCPDPSTLLLDEPLSALDDETKDEMVDLLNSVRTKTRVTILHVTHSLAEARRLADRILVLRDGKIEVQSPEESK